MAQLVVDELVTKLTLDAEPYRKVEATVEGETDRTFRKQQERARVTDRTNRDQQRRLKDISAGVKSFATQVTAAVGIVTGLGVAVGGALSGLLGFETGLRRQAVGTSLSNRQMQAWGATARRLGADAAAGAEAIAALARERQQFNLTGNGPTLNAFGRMGVDTDPSRPIEDVLAQAQQVYRAAPDSQKQQYENTLAAQGVSADLILMIKSERDVREAFTQSFSQAAEENRKALDKLADAFESIKATSIQVSATLLEALQPAIEQGAKRLAEFAVSMAGFTKDVSDAGGGLDGFETALKKNIPALGDLFEGFRMEAQLLSDATAAITLPFRELARSLPGLVQRITGWLNMSRAPWGDKPLADDVADRVRSLNERARNLLGARHGRSLTEQAVVSSSEWWKRAVGAARAGEPATAANPNPQGLPRSIAEDPAPVATASNPRGLPRSVERDVPRGTNRADAQQLMQQLITQHGLDVPQAAAVVSNWQAESALRANAFNPAGGGQGAGGIGQWRGPRAAAFKQRYGVMPHQGTLDQQVEFAMTDPYERSLLNKSLRTGTTAAEMGRGVSKYYEAHGNVREDARRGTEAQRLADNFRSGSSAGAPQTEINIQSLTVQANDANAFVGGIQRLSDSQNYNSVQR